MAKLLIVILILALLLSGAPMDSRASLQRPWRREGERRLWSSGVHRIVGGDEVRPHSKPFVVKLRVFRFEESNIFGCGGTILNEWTVVTAGHCLKKAEKVEVLAGKHDLRVREWSEQVVWSRSFTTHNGYKNDSFASRDDLALIHLPTPLNFSREVRPVVLAREEPAEKAFVHSLGWGRMSNMIASDLLRSASNQVIGDEEAAKVFNQLDFDKFICTDMNGGRGTCLGDSGGPMVNKENELVGVTSFGDKDCLSQRPQCFASIVHYKKWLENHS